ncbi:MAG: HEAT repeat domain-containing protein [Candidatus Riflebacteria bacterium]|nr:HEAT repeat domain-containing protein [Candidatus Riflebacteria bacterium]
MRVALPRLCLALSLVASASLGSASGLLSATPPMVPALKADLTSQAVDHPTVPQEVPGGLVVRYRLGRDGPFAESRKLNGHFDRVSELSKVMAVEGNPRERMAGADELARTRQDSSRDTLIRALRDINPIVRERAAVALGKFGDTKAIRPLIDMLGYSEPVRAAVAARALEQITGVRDLGPSLEAWENWYEAYRRFPHGVAVPRGAH